MSSFDSTEISELAVAYIQIMLGEKYGIKRLDLDGDHDLNCFEILIWISRRKLLVTC